MKPQAAMNLAGRQQMHMRVEQQPHGDDIASDDKELYKNDSLGYGLTMVCRTFALTLGVLLIVVRAHGDSVLRPFYDEKELEELLPPFLMDHTGFSLPRNGTLFSLPSSADLSTVPERLPILPIFPLVKKGLGSSEITAVKIPYKFLKGDKTLIQKAAAEIRKFSAGKGLHYSPYLHEGALYGIRSDYKMIRTGSETMIGLGLSLSFLSGKTFDFSEQKIWGLQLNLGEIARTSSPSGLNVAKPLETLLENTRLSFTGDQAEEIIAKVTQFTPYIQDYLIENSLSSRASQDEHSFSASRNGEVLFENQKGPKLAARIPREALSKELNSNLNDLHSKLKKEIEWRKTLKKQADSALVLNDRAAGELIQYVCDYLAAAYEVPQPIWPRCRIAATWVPNAHAMPGGEIMITAGLIGVLSDLDSVLYVLGHEIGHVVGRHTTRRMPAIKLYSYTANGLGTLLQTGLAVYGLGGGLGTLGEVTYLTWWPQGMVASMGGGYLVGHAWEIINYAPIAGLMAYVREHEWEADRFGQQSALATGANQTNLTLGMRELMDFVNRYEDSEQNWFKKLFLSHPAWEARLKKAEERYPEFSQSLAEFGRLNRLPESLYFQYNQLHNLLKSGVMNWGERNRAVPRAGKKSPLSLSLTSPSGKCVIHALGGEI